MVNEDKLKRTENIWDTSGLYNKTFLFPKAIDHDIFDSRCMHTKQELNMPKLIMNQA